MWRGEKLLPFGGVNRNLQTRVGSEKTDFELGDFRFDDVIMSYSEARFTV